MAWRGAWRRGEGEGGATVDGTGPLPALLRAGATCCRAQSPAPTGCSCALCLFSFGAPSLFVLCVRALLYALRGAYVSVPAERASAVQVDAVHRAGKPHQPEPVQHAGVRAPRVRTGVHRSVMHRSGVCHACERMRELAGSRAQCNRRSCSCSSSTRLGPCPVPHPAHPASPAPAAQAYQQYPLRP